MPSIDSLYIVSDSISMLRDTVIIDSVVVRTNTEQLVVPKIVEPTGFIGLLHPSIPATEGWVFIFLLILFFLLVLAFVRSSHYIMESAFGFFQTKRRTSIFSKTTISDFGAQASLFVFSIAVLSLYIYNATYNPNQGFHLSIFLLVFLISMIFLGLKYLFTKLIGYVFVEANNFRLSVQSYIQIVNFLGIAIFPLLLFSVYSTTDIAFYAHVGAIALSLIAILLFVIKLFQIFFNRIVVSFYLILYLCTLEIIPYFLLFWLFREVILYV